MRVRCLLFAAAVGLVLPQPGRAADAKVVKSGGHFAVEVVKDVPYYTGPDADAVKHKLDLYLPKGHKDFPVLFFVHGGAWRSGDKRLYGKLGDRFASNGIGTVIVNYRLTQKAEPPATPRNQHPTHIQDVARAFAWTYKNIPARGGRADQIFACGHSAGGHLVALLACDESYLKAEGLSAKSVKGVIPISGVYTIIPGRLSAVFGEDQEICRKASPIQHVKGSEPPFLILYAEKDYFSLDVMAENMCRRLKAAKADADVVKLKDRDHISIIRNTVHQDDPVTQAVLEFIAKHSGLMLTAVEAMP